jgi:hypothetical protein
MTPDNISFDLTPHSNILIRLDGQVMLMIGDDWYDLTNTNFGRFLVERRQATSIHAPKVVAAAQGSIQ